MANGYCIEILPKSNSPNLVVPIIAEPEPIEEPKLKGEGFSRSLPDIDQIRHIRMPPQLRKFAGKQLCKICMSNAARAVVDQVENGVTYKEVADWLTATDGNGIVYNATNVENHIRHGRRVESR